MRRDRQCHTLGLKLDDMCDKYKYVEQRKRGICGRKPGGKTIPKWENPWRIRSGITKHTSKTSIKIKQNYINILTKYKYKIVDDICEIATNSRLYSIDYQERRTSYASSSTNL